VQWANDNPALEKYVGKSVGQIAIEENKHEIDLILDLSMAGDLQVEFLGRTAASTSISTPK
jgi:N-acyl-D-aspartate/D-glutamate deacylase